MSTASHLKRWTSSISAAAIAAVGASSFINSPVVAQTAGACNLSTSEFNSGTTALPTVIRPTGTPAVISGIQNSVAVQSAARDAALAFYANNSTPNVLFSRYDSENEGADVGIVYEFRGRQLNGCQLEVDVRQRNPIGGRYRVEEIEQQLPIANQSTLPQIPAAVRNRLRSAGFAANRFQVIFIERSTRPNPPQYVPPQGPPITVPTQVFYEIEGNCTARIASGSITYCTAGQTGEATINASGTSLVFELGD